MDDPFDPVNEDVLWAAALRDGRQRFVIVGRSETALETRRVISPSDRTTPLVALDCLALALGDYGHIWKRHQRTLYEAAVEQLAASSGDYTESLSSSPAHERLRLLLRRSRLHEAVDT